VNVSIASCDGVPRRSSQYYEAALTDNVTIIVLPLPNGNCTVVYTVTVPRPGLGRIEAFDGFTTSQTKTCAFADTLCAQRLIITNTQPFAKVTVPNGQSYPTFLISYACT
jgi:hypothetical protein